uniref:Uncharacterized protein n=1 Tax=Timema cristinae TaxID=61476 RepID=A0A7R9GRL2_TIMCR|nr:unnamed protein product [Timema cristinae]
MASLDPLSPAGVSVSDSDEEPVSKHPRLSGDLSDQLTDDTGSYFEVLAQHMALSGEVLVQHMALSGEVLAQHMALSGEVLAQHMALSGEVLAQHMALSGEVPAQHMALSGEVLVQHMALSGEVLAQHIALSGEDDFEDPSVMDTSPSSALQTDDDAIMVGTTGAVCVDKPGRKLAMESTSDVNDNYNTSSNTVTPLLEDGSKFNKSNRPAPNWGTFYFRHMDTDSEQDRLSKALAPQKLCPVVPIDSSDEDDAWTYKGGTDENIHKQPLLSGSSGYISTATELKTLSGDSKKRSRQNELDKPLFGNDTNNITEKRGSVKESDVSLKLASKKECSSALMEEPDKLTTEGAPREGFAATHESKDCVNGDRSEQNCKATIRELVNQAVKMTVRDFEPLVFTQTQAKQSRVKNWIKTNSHTFIRPQDSCDASGEYTTEDSDDDKVSDSSEDQNGSVATCKHQIGHGLDSRSCSTEVFQDPNATPVNEKTLPLLTTPSPEHGKVIMRCRRRLATGEQRPWSVSGLSQLGLTGSDGALANFSISESALHQILATSASPTTPTASSPQGLLEEGSGSRTGSLRRRKVRTRRRNTGRKSESGGSGGGSGGSDTQNKSSNNLAASNRTLTKSELSVVLQVATLALSLWLWRVTGSFSGGSPPASEPAAQTVSSTEEEEQMATPVVTPQFRLGAKVTPVNPLRVREGSVGLNEEQLSSFSEQAWDNYQEKYMSEPNSEELADSEAARRLLEIDDDYRNFLDSQSDCMSSSVSTNQPRTMSPVRRRRQGALPLVDISVLDSDSDFEDVRDLIQQSQFNLMFSENVFAKQLTKTSVDLNDFVQIAATCRDNVQIAATCRDNVCILHILLGPEREGDLLSSQDCKEIREAKLPKTKPVETLKRAACDPFLKCKLAFCKTIADECQPFLQRFQTSKPMTPYLFEAVEKLLRYLMNRCVKPDLMKCTGPKLLSIDTKKSENLILSKNIDIGFATKRLLGETAITVTERQKLEFIHECRSMLTTMIAKLQEKSPLKQKAVRGLSSLDPCVIQHSPQLAQKRFSFLLEELNHANIINDVLAENAKKEYLHFCNLKKSELQEIFRPCDQFSDEVGLDTIYGSFLIGEANYKHLWEVIKICLVLSHGNATVEGGFSVNKSLLVENMHEKTVIAQRHIHDEIQEAGGIKNIHISKKMLDYVRGARKRYHEYLEMKKQEKSEKDKKKAEKRKLDIQVKDLEGERKKLMMATEEKREAIDVELQELKKKQASLY